MSTNINENAVESASQAKQMLAYMRQGNTLTGREAMIRFGVLSFSRRICDIEKMIGYPPPRRRIAVTNRRGKTVYVKQYWIEEE